MADITLKLIWYKLGEVSGNMSESLSRFAEWYSHFSVFRVDVLDMIFLGWILLSFLVVAVVTIFVKFFGRRRVAGQGFGSAALAGGHAGATGAGVRGTGAGGDACAWINSTLAWYYMHYRNQPEFVHSWISALNDCAKSNAGDVVLRFDQLRPGSHPPTVSHVQPAVAPRDQLTLGVTAQWRDVMFAVAVSEQKSSRVTHCDVAVTQIQGELKVHSRMTGEDVQVSTSFSVRPSIALTIKPRNLQTLPDTKVLENIITKAISEAVTVVTISPNHLHPHINSVPVTSKTIQPITAQQSQTTPPEIPDNQEKSSVPICRIPIAVSTLEKNGNLAKTRPDAHKESVSIKKRSLSKDSLLKDGKPSHIPVPVSSTVTMTTPIKLNTSHARSPSSVSNQDKRLLVKVIKANGLGDREYGSSDAYTHVLMDEPAQKHTTSVVKNTVNPFWDEHFLFDMTDNSRQLKLNVFDREKPPGGDFLGSAVIEIADLKRNPSSRQIIPLQNPANRSAAGTITVEFLFMEPAEAQMMQLGNDITSPRRRIETNRTVTPGGTLVTTTTTTTEKPRESRMDSSFNESPNKVQKTENVQNLPAADSETAGDSSPYSSQRSYPGTTDSSLTASQAESSQRHLGSPKLTVTGAGRDKYATLPMTESSPTDDSRDSLSLTSDQSKQIPEIKKSKSFASTLKKRFSRSKKPRSHSADRALTRDSHLLTPPGDDAAHHTTDDLDHLDIPPSGGLRKARSSSLSSSLRRLFKKKKRDGYASRDSSISRSSYRGQERGRSRESSFAQQDEPASPQMSTTGSTSQYQGSSGTATPELSQRGWSRSLPHGMRLDPNY